MLLCGAAGFICAVANPLPPYIICCSTRIFVRTVELVFMVCYLIRSRRFYKNDRNCENV